MIFMFINKFLMNRPKFLVLKTGIQLHLDAFVRYTGFVIIVVTGFVYDLTF